MRGAPPDVGASQSHRGAALVGAILLIVGLSAAISVDVVKAGYGIKSDEATYVAMTLSAAYDGDLTYQRRDLERFWGIYQQGPEGIFLKRGKQVRLRLGTPAPYVHLERSVDGHGDRLYFGKSMIYAVAAAPFVRLLGINGILVFHVLLLLAASACGYFFLAAQSPSGPALAFTGAFVGASVVPIYGVFLLPEVFNFSLVFMAYFLWLYKEVAQPRSRLLNGLTSDLLAAILLGVVTYAKPPSNAPLVLPLVLWLWWRREWWKGFVVGSAAVAAAAMLFLTTAAISGEFNYQGGDRRQFYGKFPFDAPDAIWERRGAAVATDAPGVDNVLVPSEIVRLFPNNVKYFLIGRHFGMVPYFFPGALAVLLWLASPERRRPWRVLTLVGMVVSTMVMLVLVPYTWSGGGGPPGNRYFLSVYPVLVFLTPPMASAGPALVAWLGGALFTAKMLVNPFVAAKFTWQAPERGFARRLPVELTMANDLPVMLAQPLRGWIKYGPDPAMRLYFLDTHASPPEELWRNADGSAQFGIWISGSGRAEIIARSVDRADHFSVTVESPIATRFTISAGATSVTVPIVPGRPETLDVPAAGVHGLNGYAYLVKARSTEGFTPRLTDPTARDDRNLGVLINFRPVSSPHGQ